MIDCKKLITELHGLQVETGSLVCLGCGHEHNCGVHGCAIIRDAAENIKTADDEIERLKEENRSIRQNSVSMGMYKDACAECDILRAQLDTVKADLHKNV